MKQLLLFMLLGSFSSAKVYVVLKYKNNKKFIVNNVAVADLYLRKTTKLRGIEVIPIDTRETFRKFYRQVANKSFLEFRNYWIREMYNSERIPPRKVSAKKIETLRKKPYHFSTYSFEGKTITLTIH